MIVGGVVLSFMPSAAGLNVFVSSDPPSPPQKTWIDLDLRFLHVRKSSQKI